MMRRIGQLALICGAIVSAACNRPTEDNCRKAILNVQSLYGTETTNQADFESQVRLCKGGATRKSVDCAIQAKTVAQLEACKLGGTTKPSSAPATTPPPAAPGSATAPAATGSAAAPAPAGSGSAVTDSAAPGSPGSTASAAAPASSGSAAPATAPAGSGSAAPSAPAAAH
ncbi:MAG: hypothetical protein AB7O24_22335 [Kofleriaceae bacterium]